MQKIYAEIRRLDGEVVAVCMSRPEVLADFLKRDPLPFPLLVDPEKRAYRNFDLGRIPWWKLLSPAIIGRYLKLMFGGWLPGKPNPEDDLLQLGGDFVFDSDRRLVFSHRNSDPTEQATGEELLQAIRHATHAGT